jgi:putative Holliday junction resolvase
MTLVSPPGPSPALLGLDYGDARIGVAGSDALGLLAHPLETVVSQPRPAALRRLVEIFHQRRAAGIIMGLPVRADGEEGSAAEKVRRFADSLLPLLPEGTFIAYQDEYRSTVQATEHLRAAGKRTKSHRPLIDQAAAVVILQDYLDGQAAPLPEGLADGME